MFFQEEACWGIEGTLSASEGRDVEKQSVGNQRWRGKDGRAPFGRVWDVPLEKKKKTAVLHRYANRLSKDVK